MKHFPSTELKRTLGDVFDIASREPIAITKHTKPRFVLMSYEAYIARFPEDTRKAYGVEEMPDEHLAMLESALADLPEDRA